MVSYDQNVYYNPEASGLTQVASIEYDNSCYDFDMVVVWAKEDGSLVWGADAGCSCPSPFENAHVEYLTPLDTSSPASMRALEDAAKRCAFGYSPDGGTPGRVRQVKDFIKAVKKYKHNPEGN